jgi:hypothetical protein
VGYNPRKKNKKPPSRGHKLHGRYQGVVGGRERRKVITVVEASGRGAGLTREEGVGSRVRGERRWWAGGNGAAAR